MTDAGAQAWPWSCGGGCGHKHPARTLFKRIRVCQTGGLHAGCRARLGRSGQITDCFKTLSRSGETVRPGGEQLPHDGGTAVPGSSEAAPHAAALSGRLFFFFFFFQN